MDADKRDRPFRVLLDDLVSDPHERAAHVIPVKNDRGGFQRAPSWPRWTGLKGPTQRRLAAPTAAGGRVHDLYGHVLIRAGVPAAVQDVRQADVDHVTLVYEAGLLHHPAGGNVAGLRE